MTKDEMIDAYLAGVGALRAAAAGMTREQQLARPIPGKWSTLEVVCHLADFEPIFVDRMKRIIALDHPTFYGADENQFAAKLAYHQRDLDEELAIVENTRRQFARILRAASQEVLDRIGIHNERGPKTVSELLTGATNHITHHLPFVAEKRKALGLPA
jgi:uncharacterized damage-inducible protein DinB